MKNCISLLLILIILTSCTQQGTSKNTSVYEHQGLNMIEGSSQDTLGDDAVHEVVPEPETSKPEQKNWPGETRDVDGVLMSNAAYSTQPTTVYTGDQYMDMEVSYAGKSLHHGEPDGNEEQIDEILIENCIVVVDDIYYFFQEGTGYMVQRSTVKSINGINLR